MNTNNPPSRSINNIYPLITDINMNIQIRDYMNTKKSIEAKKKIRKINVPYKKNKKPVKISKKLKELFRL